MDREMRYFIEAESQKTLMKENCDKRLARIKAEDYERHKNLAEYALNIFDVFQLDFTEYTRTKSF